MSNICRISDVESVAVKRITTGMNDIDWLYGYTKENNTWGLPHGTISLWAG